MRSSEEREPEPASPSCSQCYTSQHSAHSYDAHPSGTHAAGSHSSGRCLGRGRTCHQPRVWLGLALGVQAVARGGSGCLSLTSFLGRLTEAELSLQALPLGIHCPRCFERLPRFHFSPITPREGVL